MIAIDDRCYEMDELQKELFRRGAESANKKQPKVVHGSHNLSGEIEWYTPLKYIEAAREVMGSIDVDPATSEFAQETIQAEKYYTHETNGLTKKWAGTVWLNPPYAAKIILPFVRKLLGHLQSGEVTQAIMLTHCNTDTRWYHEAWEECAAFCQTRGRVKFVRIDGASNSPTHGHLFMYFGKRKVRFRNVFKQFGAINIPFRGE